VAVAVAVLAADPQLLIISASNGIGFIDLRVTSLNLNLNTSFTIFT
jgi:hypothetical protein